MNLNDHKRVVHDGLLFACEQCDFKTKHRSAFVSIQDTHMIEYQLNANSVNIKQNLKAV